MFYIGSSSNPKRRLSEHRYRNRRLDSESLELQIICKTDKYIEIEESLIKEELKNNSDKCINRTTSGGGGFSYLQMNEKRSSKMSEILKKRWTDPDQRKFFMEGIKKSQLINDVKKMNKKSIEILISKMPQYIAICKTTGGTFGPYRGYKLASAETGCSIDAISRTLKNKNKNKKFYFQYIGVTKC